MGLPYIWQVISGTAFKIFSLFLAVMSLDVDLLYLSYLEFVTFLDTKTNVFHQILELFSHPSIFFCSFLSSPSGTSVMYTFMPLMVFFLPLGLCSFFHSLPLRPSNHVTSVDLFSRFFLLSV